MTACVFPGQGCSTVIGMAEWTDDTIDPEGPIPVYAQMADRLEARIRAGDLAPNRKIPGELALASTYGVSRETVRRAVRELRERNLAVTSHGRGTFVVAELPPVAPPE